VLVSLALAACSDRRPLGPLRDGDAACDDLVATCQDAAALGEPFLSCYASGVRGNGDECLSVHDDCIQSCLDAPAASGGAGGEAGRGEAGGAGAPSAAGGDTGNAGGGGVAETGGTGAVTETGGAPEAGGAAEAGHASN
jgi:hypothetical protein